MLLCDHVQAAEGKLYINGGGVVVNTPGAPLSIALLIGVPWPQTNRRHHWKLFLVTADGEPVSVATPVGEQTVVVEADFEMGRPVGVPSGTELPLPIAINFGPLGLPPASQFEWRLEIDGTSEDHWRLSFFTPAADGTPGSPQMS